jgi:putative endonuclease
MNDSSPRPSTRSYGNEIEARAEAWFLKRYGKGARLLCRNYFFKGGELDLVFELSEIREGAVAPQLVLVEVRARSAQGWVDGLESVTFPKQRRLQSAIEHFLARYRGLAGSCRLDILAWDGASFRHVVDVRLT